MRNLPALYNDIVEAEALTATATNEIEMLEVAKKQVEDEQFIDTSSEQFIRIREKGWDIRADPSTESLEFRKQRIITRQSTRLPITQRKVNEILQTLVGNRYEERLNVPECKVQFVFDATDASINREIDYTLERLIPLNMELSIARRVTTKLHMPSCVAVGREITIHPMQINDIRVDKPLIAASFAQVTKIITINPL